MAGTSYSILNWLLWRILSLALSSKETGTSTWVVGSRSSRGFEMRVLSIFWVLSFSCWMGSKKDFLLTLLAETRDCFQDSNDDLWREMDFFTSSKLCFSSLMTLSVFQLSLMGELWIEMGLETDYQSMDFYLTTYTFTSSESSQRESFFTAKGSILV